MHSYVLDHKASQNSRHTALCGRRYGPVSEKWPYPPMHAWETKAVSLFVGQAEELLFFVQSRLKEEKAPLTKGWRVCVAGESIFETWHWIDNWKAQSCLSLLILSPPRYLVSRISFKKRKAEILTSGTPLSRKVLAVCLSQLEWEPAFGVNCAGVGRTCLCCNQQLEKSGWVSSVSGLFPLIFFQEPTQINLLFLSHTSEQSFPPLCCNEK